MDCIPYINDLQLEIKILEDVKKGGHCDIEEINNKIKNKQELMARCKENLSKLSDDKICYRIYLKMLNGLSASRAVEEVAEENYIKNIKPVDTTTLWKNYYKKVKQFL